MTKMHFEKASAMVRDMYGSDPQMVDDRQVFAIDSVRDAFADLFQSFNPRFDRDRFYAACEPTKDNSK